MKPDIWKYVAEINKHVSLDGEAEQALIAVIESAYLEGRKAQVKVVVDLIESMRREGNSSEANDFNSVLDDIAKAIEGQEIKP